ncbi:hypothetical protein DB313_05695 (plasmid) [Borrelia turcica IST7]|uniref:Uncharacterized protein n=1 Tax=Borrelia turcica IST7 TaxID=1104446 RepID=A0A386PP62_9SPIR|nr:hypothetical protein [Borrelia turcica]AYE36992.1 hypothetical protein DB313_05695 [Borrelia turcica IST7]
MVDLVTLLGLFLSFLSLIFCLLILSLNIRKILLKVDKKHRQQKEYLKRLKEFEYLVKGSTKNTINSK